MDWEDAPTIMKDTFAAKRREIEAMKAAGH